MGTGPESMSWVGRDSIRTFLVALNERRVRWAGRQKSRRHRNKLYPVPLRRRVPPDQSLSPPFATVGEPFTVPIPPSYFSLLRFCL